VALITSHLQVYFVTLPASRYAAKQLDRFAPHFRSLHLLSGPLLLLILLAGLLSGYPPVHRTGGEIPIPARTELAESQPAQVRPRDAGSRMASSHAAAPPATEASWSVPGVWEYHFYFVGSEEEAGVVEAVEMPNGVRRFIVVAQASAVEEAFAQLDAMLGAGLVVRAVNRPGP
jgi:hypothetical protein